MNCFYHSTNKSSISCERCNRPLCSDCIISFKNQSKYRKIDEGQRQINYIDELSYDSRVEDLQWCLPCYYAHFNNDLMKAEKISTKILSILVELFSYTFVVILLIYLVSIEFKYTIDINQFLTPGNIILLVVIYTIFSILLFNYRDKRLRERRIKLDNVKDHFLEITNIGTIDLPIECFYCKQEIELESFACMNLNCTLGEEINKDAKEVPIDPVNSNYGFFNTLKKLPKLPPEENTDEKETFEN